MTELPARPILHPGQAPDCYLEHLADANYLTAGTLMAMVTAASDTTRYLLLRPTPQTLEALGGLTGHPVDALTAATPAPLDGTLVDLSGLDPNNQYSYRDLAARGWAPGQGTQICPSCPAENGTGTSPGDYRPPPSACATAPTCFPCARAASGPSAPPDPPCCARSARRPVAATPSADAVTTATPTSPPSPRHRRTPAASTAKHVQNRGPRRREHPVSSAKVRRPASLPRTSVA
uniref:TniQ family protein n=1 Tax=Janibacter limosus TaxID=53458 RepID=A0AC61U430_9MICO|nr:TniQ family protein [Janibacter limosus]